MLELFCYQAPLPPSSSLCSFPVGFYLKISKLVLIMSRKFFPYLNNVNNLNLHHKMCVYIISLQFGR